MIQIKNQLIVDINQQPNVNLDVDHTMVEHYKKEKK